MVAKSNNTAILAIGGVVVAILVVPKLFGQKKATAASGGALAGGARYGVPQPQQDNSTLLQKILNALQNKPQQGKTSGPSASTPLKQDVNAPNPKAFGTESIYQALMSGNSSVDQSVLAGIFNIQQGAGDFAGDSSASLGQSWLDSNGWNLGDSLSTQQFSDFQDQNQQFDFGTWGQDIYGPADYTSTDYSNYFDTSSIDSFGSAGTDYSNYDWSGGNGGWDVGGGGGDTTSQEL